MQQEVPDEETDKDNFAVMSLSKDSSAVLIERFENKAQAAEQCKKKPCGVVVDVLGNKIVYSHGHQEDVARMKEEAIKLGYLIKPSHETGGFGDLVNLVRNHLDLKKDLKLFLTTLCCLCLAHYVGAYGDVLSGEIFHTLDIS